MVVLLWHISQLKEKEALFVDKATAVLYNNRARCSDSRGGKGESLPMRKVRAPQGEDNG